MLSASLVALVVLNICSVQIGDHTTGVVVSGMDVGPPEHGRVLVNPFVDTVVTAPTGPVRVSLGGPGHEISCSVPGMEPYTFPQHSIVVVAKICDLQRFYKATRTSDPASALTRLVGDTVQSVFTARCPEMDIYGPLKENTAPWIDAIVKKVNGVPGVCEDTWVPTMLRPTHTSDVDETAQQVSEVTAKNALADAETNMTEKRAATLRANLTRTAEARAAAAAIDIEAEVHAIRERGKAEAAALRDVGAAEAETTKAKVAAVGTDPVIAPAALATEALKDANSVHVVSSGVEVFPHSLS